MPNQRESKDGIPRKDADRPSPDVERNAPDGQTGLGQGPSSSDAEIGERQGRPDREQITRPMAGEEKGRAASEEPGAQEDRGEGPGKVGVTSDDQPDLVAPSGVNQRDHGVAEDKPMAGGSVNLDDDDMVHPRGKVTGAGRTWNEKNPSDAGELGAPNVGPSDRNGPSDADTNKRR